MKVAYGTENKYVRIIMIVTKWKKNGNWLLKKEVTEVSKVPNSILDIECSVKQEKAINEWVSDWAGKNYGWGWQVKCANSDNCCRYEYPESIEVDCSLGRP